MGEGPDFIGVGVQKCGTSWMAARLDEHPQVCVPEKEISFWTHHFRKGYGWYHEYFKDKGDRIAGEISPNYLFTPRPHSVTLEHYPKWSLQSLIKRLTRPHPAARDEIKEAYPDIKVFAVFRNPADRAWSHYWMWALRRKKMGQARFIVPFEKMFRDDGRWMRTHGYYARHLKYWRGAFPDMGVFLFDDLVADPVALSSSVYRFLGVDDTFVGNVASNPNRRFYESMSDGTRRMVLDHYREDIQEFSGLIGRGLSRWLE